MREERKMEKLYERIYSLRPLCHAGDQEACDKLYESRFRLTQAWISSGLPDSWKTSKGFFQVVYFRDAKLISSLENNGKPMKPEGLRLILSELKHRKEEGK